MEQGRVVGWWTSTILCLYNYYIVGEPSSRLLFPSARTARTWESRRLVVGIIILLERQAKMESISLSLTESTNNLVTKI
eukprot:scaffold22138_cov107-Amphora_coffeaeformis.AAC.1